MDLKQIASDIAEYAPMLSGLVGGPAGAAVGTGISILASALGVKPEPDAISTALKTDPQAAAKVKQAELENQVELRKLLVQARQNELAADTQRIQTVNETMQAEGKSEHWAQWLWRPYNGFMFGTTLFCNYAVPALVNSLVLPWFHTPPPQITPGIIPEWVFIAWGSVLGVTAWHRGVMQRIKASGVSQAIKSLVPGSKTDQAADAAGGGSGTHG